MRIAKPVRELGTRAPWLHEGGVRGIDIARDGNILTIGDSEARRWMLATGEMALRTERGPREGSAWDAFLFPDLERYLVWVKITDEKFVFRWWDLRNGSYLGEVPLADEIRERSILSVDRDGRRALMSTGDERCVPVIVSLEDGTVIRRLDGASERAIFLNDGRIVAPDMAHELRIWDAEGTSWKTLAPPRPVPAERNEPGTQRATYLAASRTHPYFAIGYDYSFVVFTNDGKELFEKLDHWNPAVFSRSGERVAVAASGRIVLYDMAGNEQGAVSTDAVPLDAFTIGLDHRMLIGAQGSGEIHARSTATSAAIVEPPRKETVLPGDIYSMAGAPSGGTVALSCGSGPLLLWHEAQTVPARLPGTGRSSAVVRWLSEDRLLVVTSYIVRVISTRTHEILTEFVAPGDVLSPDSKLGALGSNSGRTLIFETETGRQRSDRILEGTVMPDLLPTFGLFMPNERFCISNAGGSAWLMRNQLRAWDAEGRLRAETSLDRFVAPPPENVYTYWRALEWLSDDELLVCDSLSGLFKFDVARDEWSTLMLQTELQLGAIDYTRRRVAVSRKIPELGDDWGMTIVDADGGKVLLEIPSGGKLVRTEFLSDGSVALSTPDRRVVVWEAP